MVGLGIGKRLKEMPEPMNFDVELTEEAERQYDALDDKIVVRINIAIEQIIENPFFGIHIIKLEGKLQGQYRYRVGNYRIIYNVDKKKRIVTISGILQRGRSYR